MIGIIILNYNSFKDTIKLVSDLQNQTVCGDMRIIVVDNNSPNNSYRQLKPLEHSYNNVIVLQTGANLGYARGNNFGLMYLDKNVKPEYVAILNNDLVLPENSFEVLMKKYNLLESPAFIAPKQVNSNNKELLPYPLNSFLDDCLSLFFITKLFHKHRALSYQDTTGFNAMQVELIPGSYMFSRFETFKNIGFFYPNTFLYVEERFVATRASKLGLKNYILLDQSYIHEQSKTINSVFSQVEKFRLLYEGWLIFTLECRPYGKIKAAILNPLMKLSLLEMRFVFGIQHFIKKIIVK
tara:strand:- start:8046 stop:8933 length:888 start_codon:yes stop_codon:yes gene_type:complete